jgi:hypothetical protein
MDLTKLSERFLIGDETSPEELAQLIQKLLPYCVVHKSGRVDVVAGNLPGRELVKLVLSARLVASRLKESLVSGEVTAEEIAEYTGLPKNQAAARAKEAVDERFAERSARGSYRARPSKLDSFLDQLSKTVDSKRER